MMWGSEMGGIVWMPFAWLAFAGMVAWLVAVLIRPATPPPGGRAREILEERYARGEIDRDQFSAMRDDLSR